MIKTGISRGCIPTGVLFLRGDGWGDFFGDPEGMSVNYFRGHGDGINHGFGSSCGRGYGHELNIPLWQLFKPI